MRLAGTRHLAAILGLSLVAWRRRRRAGVRRRGRLRAHLPRQQRPRAVRDRRRYLPPALRGFPADCASRISDEPFDDGTGISFAYTLLYTDADFDEYIAILRAFERDGWIDASFPTRSTPTRPVSTRARRSPKLEALPQPPLLARTRFSSPTGLDLVEMTYASTVRPSTATLTAPAFTIEVLANQRFGTTGIADPSVLSGLRTFPGGADARADRGDRGRSGRADARRRLARQPAQLGRRLALRRPGAVAADAFPPQEEGRLRMPRPSRRGCPAG